MSGGGAAAVLVAFCASVAAIVGLSRMADRLPHAAPNARSLHTRPVPRAGGYAIWAGFLPAALWFPPSFPGDSLMGWWLPWLVVVAVSARDDVRHVAAGVRLFAHCAAALWCAWSMWSGAHPAAVTFGSSALGTLLALALAMAWAANLYNFMDGSDGLAASMTLVGFGAYGVGAVHAGASPVAYFALAAATLPFLVVNRPRATMFLGDVGAVPLGFLAAAFGAAGVFAGHWPAWFPVLVFLPFIADASVTLARRLLRGAPLAVAHKEHHYQRLHQLGAGHVGTLGAYAGAMTLTAGLALACLALAPAWGEVALGSACVVSFILFGVIDHRWRKRLPASP